MAVKIRPIVLKDVASYRRCYDAVAKERRYLFDFKASPLPETQRRMRKRLKDNTPFLVAVDGERVVGWAGVFRPGLPSLSHSGDFLMGLLPAYRGQGLGTKLAARALKMARGKFEAVILVVFRKNKPARKLFKAMGFEPCGVQTKCVKMAYGFDDALIMQKQIKRTAQT